MQEITAAKLTDLNFWEDLDSDTIKRCKASLPTTPQQFAQWDWIPAINRLWVLLRAEFLADGKLHVLACDFADIAISACKGNDVPKAAARAAVAIKREWLAGKATYSELKVADKHILTLRTNGNLTGDSLTTTGGLTTTTTKNALDAADAAVYHHAESAAWCAADCAYNVDPAAVTKLLGDIANSL